LSDKRGTLGRIGEDLAAAYLQKAGYKILARNYRQKCGEIDIIAQDRGILVFIEVKTRTTLSFGPPFAAVTEKKQKQIGKVAQDYLCRNGLFNRPARFDVVSILIKDGRKPNIDLLVDAFDLR
jgi:putative endonuclease